MMNERRKKSKISNSDVNNKLLRRIHHSEIGNSQQFTMDPIFFVLFLIQFVNSDKSFSFLKEIKKTNEMTQKIHHLRSLFILLSIHAERLLFVSHQRRDIESKQMSYRFSTHAYLPTNARLFNGAKQHRWQEKDHRDDQPIVWVKQGEEERK